MITRASINILCITAIYASGLSLLQSFVMFVYRKEEIKEKLDMDKLSNMYQFIMDKENSIILPQTGNQILDIENAFSV